jgi:hypothetical protein
MLNLDIKAAHKLVAQQQAVGNNVRWDGYDIVFWREDFRGYGHPSGEFNREAGVWGFGNRCEVNDEGTWSIDERNIRSTRRSRARR